MNGCSRLGHLYWLMVDFVVLMNLTGIFENNSNIVVQIFIDVAFGSFSDR